MYRVDSVSPHPKKVKKENKQKEKEKNYATACPGVSE
jgi:hypothetical protein